MRSDVLKNLRGLSEKVVRVVRVVRISFGPDITAESQKVVREIKGWLENGKEVVRNFIANFEEKVKNGKEVVRNFIANFTGSSLSPYQSNHFLARI
jgi:ribosome recycling factor